MKKSEKKRWGFLIILIVIIVLIIAVGVLLYFEANKEIGIGAKDLENIIADINDPKSTILYDKDGNPIDDFAEGVTGEIIEGMTVQGVVELKRDKYIYLFNGQHFGEYGFEMEEYTSTNIDNKNQKCIDYLTLKEYDTSYIQEGDILICTGDVKKISKYTNDIDTKNNPIIVLKENDYNKMKIEAIQSKRECKVTVGDYYDTASDLYLKYQISDKTYQLPFALKFNFADDIEIIGNMENGKEVKLQYKSVDVPLNELEIKLIEVIE